MSEHQEDTPAELRAAADRGRAAEAEAASLRRELVLTRAGINTDTPLGAMFAKSYDGELDVQAVQTAWAEVAPPPTAPQGEVPVTPAQTPDRVLLEETAARRTLTSGGAGDTPHEEPTPDPVKAGYEGFHEGMAAGDRRQTAAGAVFGQIIAAANAGDERVLIRPPATG